MPSIIATLFVIFLVWVLLKSRTAPPSVAKKQQDEQQQKSTTTHQEVVDHIESDDDKQQLPSVVDESSNTDVSEVDNNNHQDDINVVEDQSSTSTSQQHPLKDEDGNEKQEKISEMDTPIPEERGVGEIPNDEGEESNRPIIAIPVTPLTPDHRTEMDDQLFVTPMSPQLSLDSLLETEKNTEENKHGDDDGDVVNCARRLSFSDKVVIDDVEEQQQTVSPCDENNSEETMDAKREVAIQETADASSEERVDSEKIVQKEDVNEPTVVVVDDMVDDTSDDRGSDESSTEQELMTLDLAPFFYLEHIQDQLKSITAIQSTISLANASLENQNREISCSCITTSSRRVEAWFDMSKATMLQGLVRQRLVHCIHTYYCSMVDRLCFSSKGFIEQMKHSFNLHMVQRMGAVVNSDIVREKLAMENSSSFIKREKLRVLSEDSMRSQQIRLARLQAVCRSIFPTDYAQDIRIISSVSQSALTRGHQISDRSVLSCLIRNKWMIHNLAIIQNVLKAYGELIYVDSIDQVNAATRSKLVSRRRITCRLSVEHLQSCILRRTMNLMNMDTIPVIESIVRSYLSDDIGRREQYIAELQSQIRSTYHTFDAVDLTVYAVVRRALHQKLFPSSIVCHTILASSIKTKLESDHLFDALYKCQSTTSKLQQTRCNIAPIDPLHALTKSLIAQGDTALSNVPKLQTNIFHTLNRFRADRYVNTDIDHLLCVEATIKKSQFSCLLSPIPLIQSTVRRQNLEKIETNISTTLLGVDHHSQHHVYYQKLIILQASIRCAHCLNNSWISDTTRTQSCIRSSAMAAACVSESDIVSSLQAVLGEKDLRDEQVTTLQRVMCSSLQITQLDRTTDMCVASQTCMRRNIDLDQLQGHMFDARMVQSVARTMLTPRVDIGILQSCVRVPLAESGASHNGSIQSCVRSIGLAHTLFDSIETTNELCHIVECRYDNIDDSFVEIGKLQSSVNISLTNTDNVRSVNTIQAATRSSKVAMRFKEMSRATCTASITIQAVLNMIITSEDALTHTLTIPEKKAQEDNMISTKGMLQKLYISRLDQLNGFDTSRGIDTNRHSFNTATVIITECIEKKQEKLDLSGLNLSTLPPELALCKHVKTLCLNNNEISVLPYWFSESFKNVTSLDLSNNRLFELPEGFEQLRKLKHVDMSHNKFEYFPSEFFDSKIETLSLNNNSLLFIPSDIETMTELTHLDVSNNQLMTLPEEFLKLKKLRALGVENNRFLQSEIANVVKVFTPLLRTHKDKRALVDLMRCNSQLGYTHTSRARSGSGDRSISSPATATEDYTDLNELTELFDLGFNLDDDSDDTSTSPGFILHGRENIDRQLSPPPALQVTGEEDDATDSAYDSDSSSSSLSFTSSPRTPANRIRIPSLNLTPNVESTDEEGSLTFDSPVDTARSSSTSFRLRAMSTPRRFIVDQKPESSVVYQFLSDIEFRIQLKQFCVAQTLTDCLNAIEFWEGAFQYKTESNDQARKTKIAELYYTYLSSVSDKKVSVPIKSIDLLTSQIEEELYQHKHGLPQSESNGPSLFILNNIICIVQDFIHETIQMYNRMNNRGTMAGNTTDSIPSIEISQETTTVVKEQTPARPSHQSYRQSMIFDVNKIDKQTLRELNSLRKEQQIDYKERINLLFEILESERKYLKFLQVLQDLYYEPIMLNKNTGVKTGLFAKRFVPEKVAKQMFPFNLKAIIAVNNNFLRKVEERFGLYQGKDPVSIYFMMIADLFIKTIPFLDVYISYLTMYDPAMGAIRQYRAKHKEFEVWANKTKKNKRSCGLDMGSLFIMPVQRIPRYEILLKNLLKQTPPDHGDYDNLQTAIEMITECAKVHNERIREANNKIKVQQIGRMLRVDKLATDSRRLVREGQCVFKEAKQKAYLFNDMLILREKKKLSLSPTVRIYSLIDAVIMGGSQVSVTLQANCLSSAKLKAKIFDISFNSFETKIAWLKDITNSINQVDVDEGSNHGPISARTLTQRLRTKLVRLHVK